MGLIPTSSDDENEGYLVRAINRGQYDFFTAFLDLYKVQDSLIHLSLMNYVIAIGNDKMLKLLIERGNSAVKSHDQHPESSPLRHAISCRFGSTPEILEILIAAGAFIDCDIMRGIVSKGSPKAIRMVVEKGITFKIDGELLHRTVSRSDPEVLLILLPLIISSEILNERFDGLSALHRALLHPTPRCAVPLIKAGIDLDTLDQKNITPLHYALLGRHFDIAIVLITAGCRLNVGTMLRGSELHYAIRPNSRVHDSYDDSDDDDQYMEVEYIDYAFGDYHVGGFPDDEDYEKKKPASLLTVVYLLLAHGADVDLHGTHTNQVNRNLPGIHLETPLWHAIKHGYRDVVWAILTMGSHRPDLTITDLAGRTPLQFARERGNRHIIRMLEEYEESPWMMPRSHHRVA
ncbi:ankyrin repeat-containing domain protein [Penicillium malachiteum]|uniref:ankyrin repeat-containing domain protein n=1 Tax=Penicillium malachiteum TaxID=1324776 RepID=UPI00254845CE|nr:ankyrin repeat-containing domain protein [Penicillium malachiteum]KAJ5729420.1 ankyrin repeat-containing domain protein [Penicillium malachiteum]